MEEHSDITVDVPGKNTHLVGLLSHCLDCHFLFLFLQVRLEVTVLIINHDYLLKVCPD